MRRDNTCGSIGITDVQRPMLCYYMDRVKRIWYLSPMRAAKVQASLRIRAVSPEPSLLAHTSSESRGIFRQKARSLAPLNGWACAVKMCHDGMLEDTNSLEGAHITKKMQTTVLSQHSANYSHKDVNHFDYFYYFWWSGQISLILKLWYAAKFILSIVMVENLMMNNIL